MDTIPKNIWKKLQEQASDTLNDEFWDDIASVMPQRAPRVDLLDGEREIVVYAEVPGVSKASELQVSAGRRSLRIGGRLPCGYDGDEEERLVLAERYCGDFKRTLSLPAEIEPSSTRATLVDGILTIRMPKRPEEDAKPVQIREGEPPEVKGGVGDDHPEA